MARVNTDGAAEDSLCRAWHTFHRDDAGNSCKSRRVQSNWNRVTLTKVWTVGAEERPEGSEALEGMLGSLGFGAVDTARPQEQGLGTMGLVETRKLPPTLAPALLLDSTALAARCQQI